jgi:hypothetical protein
MKVFLPLWEQIGKYFFALLEKISWNSIVLYKFYTK